MNTKFILLIAEIPGNMLKNKKKIIYYNTTKRSIVTVFICKKLESYN